MSLFNFIYNTFQERVNLKTIKGVPNKYYLPDVLAGINDPNTPGKKLLPLTSESWNLGKISSQQGRTISDSIATWYSTYLRNALKLDKSSVGIVDPANPDPTLGLSNLTINGLNNIFALPNPLVQSSNTGYTTTISLSFNQVQNLTKLNIYGEFSLQQAVCRKATNSTPFKCDGYCMNVEGKGHFQVDFIDADVFIDAQVFISVSGIGNNRKMSFQINKLTFRGLKNPNPTFKVTVIDITNALPGLEEIWVQSANDAFDSPEAKANMIASLNQTLNSDNNRNSLANTLLSQLNNGIDSIFGPVPASGLPDDSGQQVDNPADLYILDRVKASLNAPTSNYYIPTILKNNSNPQLEPLSTSSIDLGSQTIAGLPWAPNVFSNILITGLSNNIATPSDIVFSILNVSIKTTQGQLNPPPAGVPAPPLNINGNFSCTPQGGDPITGTFLVTVSSSNLAITCVASGDKVENLNISISSLQLIVNPSQMNITLSFTDGSPFTSFVNKFLGSDSIKNTVISKLNGELASASTLNNISSQVTNTIKNVITSQFGN